MVGKKREYDLEGMAQLIADASKGSSPLRVFIEKARAMPIKFKIKDTQSGKEVVRSQGATSLFSYGGGYFAWMMACVCHGVYGKAKIPYTLVIPQRWKKIMLRDMPKDKNSSIMRAKQLHPGINLIPENGKVENEGLAEAYLIARYGGTQSL